MDFNSIFGSKKEFGSTEMTPLSNALSEIHSKIAAASKLIHEARDLARELDGKGASTIYENGSLGRLAEAANKTSGAAYRDLTNWME